MGNTAEDLNMSHTGILRSPNSPNIKPKRNSTGRIGSPNRSVHFEPPSDLQNILTRYSKGQSRPDEIEGLLTHMVNLRGQALISWLQELQENVAILKPKLENFVFAVLKIPWAGQDLPVVTAFRNFLINLLTAQTYYLRPTIKMLFTGFIGRALSQDDKIQQDKVFRNIHNVIQAILHISPMQAKKELLYFAKECFPFMLVKNECHTRYLENLLRLSEYLSGEDRVTILRIVVARLVELDVHLPKFEIEDDDSDSENEDANEVFDMECDDQDDNKKTIVTKNEPMTDLQIAQQNLDNGMKAAFNYVETTSKKGDEHLKQLYFDMMKVFESQILPTYASGHVQFLMFYLISHSPALYGHFLDWLWKKFSNPSTPNIIRQSAVSYIASLVARGRYINIHITKACLEKLCQWVHDYIRNQDSSRSNDYMHTDIKAHGPFYAACQSALYVFAFRHDEFVHNKEQIAFLRKLSFNTIVTCQLNPLRVCLPPVVKNFASIARNYQLAYCDTIIQRNNRINLPVIGNLSGTHTSGKPLLLDSFFPFDPYLLKDSKPFIEPLYREYKGAVLEDSDSDESDNETEMDDQLDDIVNVSISKSSVGSVNSIQNFMYGTSPGFKL